jgi:hypothetical protein
MYYDVFTDVSEERTTAILGSEIMTNEEPTKGNHQAELSSLCS